MRRGEQRLAADDRVETRRRHVGREVLVADAVPAVAQAVEQVAHRPRPLGQRRRAVIGGRPFHDDRQVRRAADEIGGAQDRRRLGAFDVHVQDVDGRSIGEQRIEAPRAALDADIVADRRGHPAIGGDMAGEIDVLPQAVLEPGRQRLVGHGPDGDAGATGELGIEHEVDLEIVDVAGGAVVELDDVGIARPVERPHEVGQQQGVGLDGDHPAAAADAVGAQHHVVAEVGAEIDVAVAGLEQGLDGARRPGLDDAVADEADIDVDVPGRHHEPGAEGQAHRDDAVAQGNDLGHDRPTDARGSTRSPASRSPTARSRR